MELTKEYLQDEKQLFEFYLNTDLFPAPIEPKKYFVNKNALEIIVRPQCNLKCEYCYIKERGNELYPQQLNKEDTLKNIELFLDYIYNIKRNYFYEIELFAGDLLYDEILLDIIDLFKKHFTKIKKEAPQILRYTTNLCIPSNLVNIYKNPELGEKLITIFQDLRKEFNVRANFSWSTDGMYGTDTREKTELTEEYFDTLFEFCKKTNSGIHPMTSAKNIDYAIENYDWWLKKIEEHDYNADGVSFQPMMLEVRNDDWTDEAIEKYMQLLDHMMKKRFEMCNYSVQDLTYHLFIGDGANGTLKMLENYDPLRFPSNAKGYFNEEITCSAQNTIMLNCTNLSLVFCHRTTYSHLTPVYFITDEEKNHIVDYKVNNVGAYISLKTFKRHNHPICVKCIWKEYCLGGCLGAQFESSGELFFPVPSVCNMFKTKFKHLLQLYADYGVLREVFMSDDFIRNNQAKQQLKELCREAGVEIEQ